jgi:hypothetical protein
MTITPGIPTAALLAQMLVHVAVAAQPASSLPVRGVSPEVFQAVSAFYTYDRDAPLHRWDDDLRAVEHGPANSRGGDGRHPGGCVQGTGLRAVAPQTFAGAIGDVPFLMQMGRTDNAYTETDARQL